MIHCIKEFLEKGGRLSKYENYYFVENVQFHKVSQILKKHNRTFPCISELVDIIKENPLQQFSQRSLSNKKALVGCSGVIQEPQGDVYIFKNIFESIHPQEVSIEKDVCRRGYALDEKLFKKIIQTTNHVHIPFEEAKKVNTYEDVKTYLKVKEILGLKAQEGIKIHLGLMRSWSKDHKKEYQKPSEILFQPYQILDNEITVNESFCNTINSMFSYKENK